MSQLPLAHTGCQDPGRLKVRIDTIYSKGNKTYAKLNLKFPMESKEISIILENTKNKWLIDEVIDTSYGNQGLHQFLADSLLGNNKRNSNINTKKK
jgi:hypothetical protein